MKEGDIYVCIEETAFRSIGHEVKIEEVQSSIVTFTHVGDGGLLGGWKDKWGIEIFNKKYARKS